MSSFFTAPVSQRKRKRTDGLPAKPRKRQDVERSTNRRGKIAQSTKSTARPVKKQEEDRDDSVSGSDETGSDIEPELKEESDATSEEDETAAERRVRLAQRYLDRIKDEAEEVGFDAADLDKDIIAKRLREDVDEQKGRQFRLIASTLDWTRAEYTHFRADTQATTGIAVCKPYVYTVSKDRTLIKWQIQPAGQILKATGVHKHTHNGKRRPQQLAYIKGVKIRADTRQQHGHTKTILSVAASPDGRYVATGGADKKLIIWAAEDLTPLKTFYTHRDAVTGLDFAPISGNNSGFGAQLFSASTDRSIKTYSLAGNDSLAYVETLFGHQDHVVDISAMAADQCVSVGARDKSARLWRVVDETQLKFLGDSSRHDEYHVGSLDCVAALPPQHFVTGSDSGAITLWSMHRKKAVFAVQTAHGVDPLPPLEEVTSESDPKVIEELKKSDKRRPIPRAITALVALPGTDVVLSGSWDGEVRIWKVSDDKRTLISLGSVSPHAQSGLTNGAANSEFDNLTDINTQQHRISSAEHNPIRGVINCMAVFERRKEIVNEFGGTKEGECQGLCIVAGTGKELRLGNWRKFPKGKNGAIVFEIPLKGDIA